MKASVNSGFDSELTAGRHLYFTACCSLEPNQMCVQCPNGQKNGIKNQVLPIFQQAHAHPAAGMPFSPLAVAHSEQAGKTLIQL